MYLNVDGRVLFFLLVKSMAPVGIEPKTFALLARRSNQLSYAALDTKDQISKIPKQIILGLVTLS